MEKKSITFIYCGSIPNCYAMYRLLNVTPDIYTFQESGKGPQHLNQKFIAVRKITPEMNQILTDHGLLNRLLYFERKPRNDELDVIHEFDNVTGLFAAEVYNARKTFKGSQVTAAYFQSLTSTNRYVKYLEQYENNTYLILLTEYLLFTSGYTALISYITSCSPFRRLLLTESIQDIAINHLGVIGLLECLP
jgi:hypothetical protein